MPDPAAAKLSFYLSLTAMLVIFAAFVLGNFLWLMIDQGAGWDDTTTHAAAALGYLDTGEMNTYVYPPLTHYLNALGNLVSGRRDDIGSLFVSMPFFTLIFMAGMYLSGIRLGNPWIGVAAAMLTASTPAFFHSSRLVLLEFPVTALLVLYTALLIRSDLGLRRPYAVLAGFTAGIGMLTKMTFAFYVLPSVFLLAYSVIAGEQKRQILVNCLLMAGVCSLTCGFWYLLRLEEILKVYIFFGFLDPYSLNCPPLFSSRSALFYWKQAKELLLSHAWLTLFALSSIYSLFALKDRRRDTAAFLTMIVGVYIVFTLIRSKQGRYLIPLLPFVMLVIASGLSALPWKIFRTGLLGLLTVIAFSQYFSIGFGSDISPRLNGILSPFTVQQRFFLWKPYAPVEKDILLNILLDIARDKKPGRAVTICALGGTGSPTAFSTALSYVNRVNRLPFDGIYFARSRGELLFYGHDYAVVCNEELQSEKYALLGSYDSGLHEDPYSDTTRLYRKKSK